MQYEEVILCEALIVNSNGQVTTSIPVFQTEGISRGGKLILHCSAASGTSPSITPKLHTKITSPAGNTYDITLPDAIAAITAVGDTVIDLLNVPRNLYIAFGNISGTTPSLTITAILILQ